MKKTFLSLLVAGISSVAAFSTPAAAQDSAAIAKVPFEFIVGNKVLPAGDYMVASQTNDWSVVLIRSTDSGIGTFASTKVAPGPDTPAVDARLSFVNYDGHYFLKRIAIPGRNPRQIAVTREQAERTLARLNLMTAESASPAK